MVEINNLAAEVFGLNLIYSLSHWEISYVLGIILAGKLLFKNFGDSCYDVSF